MKIKFYEEDFNVEEVPLNVELHKKQEKEDEYAYFLLEKKGWDTPRLVDEVSRRLRINRKTIGYAGNKDKKAVTKQRISIPIYAVNSINDVERLDIKGCKLEFIGYSRERITLGDLKGNKFVITVRQLDGEKEINLGKIKNYFGEQRFGRDGINIILGRAIVKNDFLKACNLLGLKVKGNAPVTSLREVDSRVLRLYVNAYQSWMWNCVAKKVDNPDEIEVIGFLTEFKDKNVEMLYKEIMEKEGISQQNFLIKQFKEISNEGTIRKLYLNAKDFKTRWEDDDAFHGKKKCIITFELDKGCYATVVLNSLF